MTYTQQQLSDFWYGPGGSEENIVPGAYVTMTSVQVIQLTNPLSPAYSAYADNILTYIYQNRLFGFANYIPGAAGNISYQGRVTGK